MPGLHEVVLRAEPIDRFAAVVGEAPVAHVRALAERLRKQAKDRIVWNVNSTAVGGGVAEMLQAILPYARGAGIDARWVVLSGPVEFFSVTKRLHNALHGMPGDGSPLGDEQRAVYESTARENAQELLARVRPGDVVVLHDPQTAALAGPLAAAGANILWRCHIGADEENEETARGWAFLRAYVEQAHVCIFSREAYVPKFLDRRRVAIVIPSIDPFSPKNQELPREAVLGIVGHVGLVAHTGGSTSFEREDGSPGRVDRFADVLRLGPPPEATVPLVVQVSRWDDLKDPIGVMHGFARLAADGRRHGAELLLAGPNVHAVADDPDGARVFDAVTRAWRDLPHSIRKVVHLASLPTNDVEENGAIVNALQRHAAVIVQKSLREGFGLTVTEAMWKARPIVASGVGGIVDQIEDGVHGVLLHDPTDLDAFAEALAGLLEDRTRAEALGNSAKERARERFLALRSLVDYGGLIERLGTVAT